jgi:hypothetical protein
LELSSSKELLNSKANHSDHHCGTTPWRVELARCVNSPRFRLLYDIHQMQIMEGDVIRMIRPAARSDDLPPTGRSHLHRLTITPNQDHLPRTHPMIRAGG